MTGRPGASNGVFAGAAWLVLSLALCAAPLAIVLAGPTPPGRDFRTELAVGLGFLALAVMCLQFVLTARFRRLKAPYGSDLVYAFHRDITFAVLESVDVSVSRHGHVFRLGRAGWLPCHASGIPRRPGRPGRRSADWQGSFVP